MKKYSQLQESGINKWMANSLTYYASSNRYIISKLSSVSNQLWTHNSQSFSIKLYFVGALKMARRTNTKQINRHVHQHYNCKTISWFSWSSEVHGRDKSPYLFISLCDCSKKLHKFGFKIIQPLKKAIIWVNSINFFTNLSGSQPFW